MYEWRDVGSRCEYCGKPIEQRPVTPKNGYTLKGFEPMEYRHKSDKEHWCKRVLRDEVRPFDGCGQYKKYMMTPSAEGE